MNKKKVVIGILAHVDAGKTTLAENMLYESGVIRTVGRVDNRDTFLDTHVVERERGITVFSKQAVLELGEYQVMLLDTPGHADFSPEMERTLRVLDYAVLVISATDGVQGHVLTLWRLLEEYKVPTFIFINKMDQERVSKSEIIEVLKKRLDTNCVSFDSALSRESIMEEVSMVKEEYLEYFLANDCITDKMICDAVQKRQLFPCYLGSALKQEGVKEFMQGLAQYVDLPKYTDDFGAIVFKISRDDKGARLTHLKITGGSLKVKQVVTYQVGALESEEKVDQIRIYNGNSYEVVQVIEAGGICAVTGLDNLKIGQGIGKEAGWEQSLIEPVLNYNIVLPIGVNVYDFYLKLKKIEEEEPHLKTLWKESDAEVNVKVMGKIQLEILKREIWERYQIDVGFGEERITYKETIVDQVIGIGHFEPLRHYAEVHLLLEPGKRGSGIEVAAQCSEEVLGKNWQHLIQCHILEKAHKGVLIGEEITDVKVTVVAGKAHLKHTEGGDFRQATYRAIRQGLMQSESVILEPVYQFEIEAPVELTGRILTDIQRMKGRSDDPIIEKDLVRIKGVAPVATMRFYHQEVASFSKGFGRISCILAGYEECHNQEEIITQFDYHPERDSENPVDSIFCSHGAGYNVSWNEVREHAHVEYQLKELVDLDDANDGFIRTAEQELWIDEEEIDEIMNRTFLANKKNSSKYKKKKVIHSLGNSSNRSSRTIEKNREKYLLVDGYNIIFAWEELKELAKSNIDSARDKLMDLLSDYRGYYQTNLIVVFDGYKVKGNLGSAYQYHNIYVIYTKEAETADTYIERTVQRIGKEYDVTVATSDAMEQMIIMGQGAKRMSARNLYEEIHRVKKESQEEYKMNKDKEKMNVLGEYFDTFIEK